MVIRVLMIVGMGIGMLIVATMIIDCLTDDQDKGDKSS